MEHKRRRLSSVLDDDYDEINIDSIKNNHTKLSVDEKLDKYTDIIYRHFFQIIINLINACFR